jgi:hypothetical protein
MRVSHDDVADLAALYLVGSDAYAPGVNRNAIIYQKAGQALRRVSAPAGVKRAG